MSKTYSEDFTERWENSSLTMYEKLYARHEHDVYREMLDAMSRYGVHRLEATYSGGHDEGGVEEIDVLLGASGDPLEIEGVDDWNHDLNRLANEVLSTKFYSWAFDFSAMGRLIVDINERRIWTEGEVERYAPDQEPIEWIW